MTANCIFEFDVPMSRSFFRCDVVGETAKLHMHGVHFRRKADSLLVWMDMTKNGEVAFQTKYELARADSD
jgi:hypothetical protein